MAVMAGQVKHKQIFSSIRPDWRLAKLLLNLRTRNTDMLLGAVAKAALRADALEGIEQFPPADPRGCGRSTGCVGRYWLIGHAGNLGAVHIRRKSLSEADQ